MDRCQPVALGTAIGALWALCIGCLGIMAMFNWGTGLIAPLASLYLGYGPSATGALIGAVWAFVDGFIAGVVIALVYNLVAKRPTR